MLDREFEKVTGNSELLREAEEIKKDIFILSWEMGCFLKKPVGITSDKDITDIKNMMTLLDDDVCYIDELITSLKSENETV